MEIRKLKADLLADFPDNTTGEIKAIHVRNFVVSAFPHRGSAPPTNQDDSAQGFDIGSLWEYDERIWICASPDADNAVWLEIVEPQGGTGQDPAPVSFSFNDNGEAYYVARESLTLGNPVEAGTGTLSYEKALAADTSSFTSTSLPVSLDAGDVLKVILTGTTSYKALTLERTA